MLQSIITPQSPSGSLVLCLFRRQLRGSWTFVVFVEECFETTNATGWTRKRLSLWSWAHDVDESILYLSGVASLHIGPFWGLIYLPLSLGNLQLRFSNLFAPKNVTNSTSTLRLWWKDCFWQWNHQLLSHSLPIRFPQHAASPLHPWHFDRLWRIRL